MNYTQKIYAVDILPEVDGLSNVIVRVKWEYRARKGTSAVCTVHTTDLDSVADTTNFVPFDQLTEELVLGWINSKEDMSALKASIDSLLESELTKIDQQKIPPWENTSDNIFTRQYVLVNDDTVLWGPARWNTNEINNALHNNGFLHTLPNIIPIIPENAPLEIETNLKIYRVLIEIEDDFLFNHFERNFNWDFSGNIAIYKSPIRELIEYKKVLLDYAMSACENCSHTITYENREYEINCSCFKLYKNYYEIMSNNETREILSNDGLQTLNKVQLGEIFTLLYAEIEKQIFETANHIQQINDATTLDQLKIIYQEMV
jgi:hypothetical protein